MQGRYDRSLCTAAWILLAVAVGVGIVAGCSSFAPKNSQSPKSGLIGTTPDGKGFIDRSSRQPFIPFGTNYYDPNTGWAPKIWQQFDPDRVAGHFAVMKKLGVNCARVFLTAATFQPDVNTIDPEALAKLDELVRIAREAEIRLILTGPDHWEGSPAYWRPDRFGGEEALRALDNFWTVVGRRYRGEPAIFAWDLLNEPQMPWSNEAWQPRWNAWLVAKYHSREGLKAAWGGELGDQEKIGDIRIPENKAVQSNPRLLDWQLFRESLADEWVRRQVEALRRADPTHLITVGYIQWSYPVVRPGDPGLYAAFNPHRQKQWLDFISIHFYPLMGAPFGSRDNWEKNLAYLQTLLAYCHAGKPVVLEEYGWYGGGAPQQHPYLLEDQQARWIGAEIEASRRLAQGWLSWPFADTPDSRDMSLYGGLVKADMVNKMWGLRFQVYASNLAALPQPEPELPGLDYLPSLTTPLNDLAPMYDKQAEMVQTAIRQAGPVPTIVPPNTSQVPMR